MTNEYEEAIGVWNHQVGKITHKIIPEENDNFEFIRLKSKAEKSMDGSILFKGVADLYFQMVKRSKPELNEDTEKDLKRWIGVNINQIIEDFTIAFNWTTKEKLEEIKKNIKL